MDPELSELIAEYDPLIVSELLNDPNARGNLDVKAALVSRGAITTSDTETFVTTDGRSHGGPWKITALGQQWKKQIDGHLHQEG